MSGMSYNDKHPYWGPFATTADLPNVSGAGVQSAGLEVGDFAFCIADSTHYKCTTATPGAAVWAAMGGGASVIPKSFIVVGNAVSGDTSADCDYLDTGNGAQLAAAVVAATGAARQSVYVRRGTYDFTLPGAPAGAISVLNGIQIIGASMPTTGITGVIIKTRATGSLQMFTGDYRSWVKNLSIIISKPTALMTGSYILGIANFEHIFVEFEATWTATEVNYAASLFAVFYSVQTSRQCTVSGINFNSLVPGRMISGFRSNGGGSGDHYYNANSVGCDYSYYSGGTDGMKLFDSYGYTYTAGGTTFYIVSASASGRVKNCYLRNNGTGDTVYLQANYWFFSDNKLDGGGSYSGFNVTGDSNILVGNTLNGPKILLQATAGNTKLIGNVFIGTAAGVTNNGTNTEFYSQSMIVVGNSTEGDTQSCCDYLDSGNGAQLAAAIAASVGRTVFIRPGVYDLNAAGAPSTPIVVDRCRLIGAGPRATYATAGSGQGVWIYTKQSGNLMLFDFSSGVSGDPAMDFAGMENIKIQAIPPTGAISGSSFIYRGSHKNVYIHLNTGTSGSYQWYNTHINRAASLVAFFEEPYQAEDCIATTAPYNFNYWVAGRRISAFRVTSSDYDDVHGALTRCAGAYADYGFYLDYGNMFLFECYTEGSSVDSGGAGIYLGSSTNICKILNGTFIGSGSGTTGILVNGTSVTISGNTISNNTGAAYLLDFSSTGDNNVISDNVLKTGTVRFQSGASRNVNIGNHYSSVTLTDLGTLNSFLDGPLNFSVSPIGGMMFPIINNSGGTLLAGRVLSPDTANNYSGVLSPTSDLMPIGIVYADIANGATGWMVIAGYADVYFDNAGAVSRKDWAGVSTTTAGACTASAGDPGASHWREVGHVMQAITGPGLARCIIHFN